MTAMTNTWLHLPVGPTSVTVNSQVIEVVFLVVTKSEKKRKMKRVLPIWQRDPVHPGGQSHW